MDKAQWQERRGKRALPSALKKGQNVTITERRSDRGSVNYDTIIQCTIIGIKPSTRSSKNLEVLYSYKTHWDSTRVTSLFIDPKGYSRTYGSGYSITSIINI